MEPFKNKLSYGVAMEIGAAVGRVYGGFGMEEYGEGLEEGIAGLELKGRAGLIAERVARGLPDDVVEMFSILKRAIVEGDLEGFVVWPLTMIVMDRGGDCFEDAMDALELMTQKFTSEFAIRPFLRNQPERVFEKLHAWCGHENEHVRRLVSEGSRPFLPWGGNLPELLEAPFPTLDLLEKLHRDPSAYVRLSVSNHLNDFSKRYPKLVVDVLRRWLDESSGDAEQEKLARHACRTLLKAGDVGALELLGFGDGGMLEVERCEVFEDSVRLGESLGYAIVVRNVGNETVRVMFDYAIHHMKANGSLSAKVFKGRKRELAAGEVWEIKARHVFRKVTTRVYHAGTHVFEPRLNGRVFEGLGFVLEV